MNVCAAPAGKEFVIIGNPQAAQLYDQYEQQLTPSQKKALPHGMPLEIVAKRQLMGDQITPGMRLSFSNETYYLMLDEGGRPNGLPPSADAQFYRNCTYINDTLAIAAVSVPLADNETRHLLKKGDLVIRLFKNGEKHYLFHAASNRFGWTDATLSAFSRPSAKKATVIPTFNDLHLRIMKRLELANCSYDTLFTFFNTLTHQDRSTPKWIAAVKNGVYSYSLVGSAETVTQLESSTDYLLNDVERMLLGRPFSAHYRAGTITITDR